MDPIQSYTRRRMRLRKTKVAFVSVFGISLILGFTRDDWSRFDHQSFKVLTTTPDGFTIVVGSTTQPVHLLGIRQINPAYLANVANAKNVTLLLDSPQTRDPDGHLRAFAFLNHRNLAVELVKAGQAKADHRDANVFQGDLLPAEATARKANRGI